MNKKNLALGLGGAVGAIVAWKFLARASEVNWEKVADKVHHPEHSHFIEVDGATIHYQEFGEKNNPTLILIHGFTASTYVWHSVAPRFAGEGFHVIAVDLLGFGYSEKPASFEYTIEAQARMIARLMNRLGIGTATIVGSSYGGAVAATVALDYPERVEKLVLVDAVINDDPKSHPVLRLASIPGVGELVTPFLVDSKRFLKKRMQATIAPVNHHLITKDRIDSVIRPLNAANAHRSVLQTSRNWNANRIEKDAQYIKQPTLIVWGEQDQVIPLECGEKLYGSILNSRFVILKNCGHVPQEEKSDLFAELVTGFCKHRKGQIAGIGDEEQIRMN
ncbi:MAG TPA: alpha/beta hydrolase [Pyrinomonadaceae bacterium]|jgi:pimeloyl-ACP methyl ester carboxylesterase